MKPSSLRDRLRSLAVTWAALIVLLLTSLGSAYLRLGIGNLLLGLAIALVKSAVVVWLFMHLRAASAAVRLAGAMALATLLLLVALTSVDYATRPLEAAAFQPPGRAPSATPASR